MPIDWTKVLIHVADNGDHWITSIATLIIAIKYGGRGASGPDSE